MTSDRDNSSDKPAGGGHGHWLKRGVHNGRTHFRRRPSKAEFRREGALREWFGPDRSVEEIAELRPPPQLLRDILPQALDAVGIRQADTLSRLQDNWGEVVGEDIARQTVPSAIRGKVLWIEVSDATWRFILERQQRVHLRRRLRSLFPEDINDIRFVPPGRSYGRP